MRQTVFYKCQGAWILKGRVTTQLLSHASLTVKQQLMHTSTNEASSSLTVFFFFYGKGGRATAIQFKMLQKCEGDTMDVTVFFFFFWMLHWEYCTVINQCERCSVEVAWWIRQGELCQCGCCTVAQSVSIVQCGCFCVNPSVWMWHGGLISMHVAVRSVGFEECEVDVAVWMFRRWCFS